MPELPEVETLVRQLRGTAIGKRFWKVEGRPASVFVPSLEDFKDMLPGLRILDVARRGKFIVFVLERNMRLVVHLRMTGRLMWKKLFNKEAHVRAVFTFSDATTLYFCDARKFGRLWLAHKDEINDLSGMSRLGTEALEVDFEEFCDLLGRRRGLLKANLLRQDVIAGLGNIYVDEACFGAALHPERAVESLKNKDLKKLYESMRRCLEEGIEHCGVTLSDFRGTRGELGKHQDYLQIYGRVGDPCYKCEKTIAKKVVAGRGTYYCSSCQKLS